MRGFFSDFHYENLVELQEVKLKKVWSPTLLNDWAPLEFLTLRGVHTKPPEIHQLQVFLPEHWFPQISAQGFPLW